MNENLTREEALERAAVVSGARYEVAVDLAGAEGFRSETVVRFRAGPGASTFLDCTAGAILEATLNGEPLPGGAIGEHRIALDHLADENEVRVVADMAFRAGEHGLTRFVDPVDGEAYVYSDSEPFGAHRWFACFDQPDIKGPFRIRVTAPAGWEVASNLPLESAAAAQGESRTWTYEETPPLPPYLAAVVGGPFNVVRDEHRDIPLGLYCRRSLAEHLDPGEIFEITKQGLDYFEEAFGYPYPFKKYDQLFVPEYAAGAMENPGCVTFNETYIFRSRVTEARRETRAGTILHEMAHMWFGDLVTMRWWDDLWLNETFASFAAEIALEGATRFTENWATFAHADKAWASAQDQLPTTHPIVADVPDVESVFLNFDGITYAKGASVIRQLVAWVGMDAFLEGMRAYFPRHAFGNATLADFLGALEEASGRDLGTWSKRWLETAGINTLRAEREAGALAIVQEGPEREPVARPHRLVIGAYGGSPLRRTERVELDVAGDRTPVEGIPAGAPLLLVNDEDLTYAKVRLDPTSLATARERLSEIDDPLARAVLWRTAWDLTRDGLLPARHFLDLVLDHVGVETNPSAFQRILAQAAGAVSIYGDPANRIAAGTRFAAAALEALEAAERGSDLQLSWARTFAAAARTGEQLDRVAAILDGSAVVEGLAIDTELRWHLVRALAAAGRAGDAAIAAELERDPTDQGTREAAAARAARPTPDAKAEAWMAIAEDPATRPATFRALLRGFNHPEQEELLEPYAPRFFAALGPFWEERDTALALQFARDGFPSVVSLRTIELTDAALGDAGLPAPLARPLLEGKDGVTRALRAREADASAG